MKNLSKYLMSLALVVALGACGSKDDVNTGNDVDMYANLEVSLGAPVRGVALGSQEDLDVRAGNMVHFAYDRYNIDRDAAATLKRQALWLKAFPDVSIIVEGHADERGTRKYNQALGERRADAVKRYLVANGISARRITTVSYGKDRPLVAESNEAAWAKNRRAVSVITK